MANLTNLSREPGLGIGHRSFPRTGGIGLSATDAQIVGSWPSCPRRKHERENNKLFAPLPVRPATTPTAFLFNLAQTPRYPRA
jgi:hypothetical protein